MSTIVEEDVAFTKALGRGPIFYYGMGHMLNDITAACWFTYLLLFLMDIGFSPRNAAIVMLSGQVADGFATVFVGELIDRFGHFKIWHGAGSILVAISFSSVFGGCLPCTIFTSDSVTFETVSYSVFAAIFNLGWAATQVSHMSMVSCITLNSTSRVALASCRNAFTMVANLSLYGIALLVFSVVNGKTFANVENQMDVHGRARGRISWAYWFKRVLYYQVALIYLLTRLIVNVSQAYLAFYVINDLQMDQSAKALVPAIIYISCFIVSIALQEIAWNSKLLKAYFSTGCILWIFCGAVIMLLTKHMSYAMYIVSVFIGIANALMMVTGVSMQNFLIGENLNGCAFVVGSLSFLDKMSSFSTAPGKSSSVPSFNYKGRVGSSSCNMCITWCDSNFDNGFPPSFKLFDSTTIGIVL
ncbi:major facilitator superfamily domain-containing protein 12-like [Trifolium pratense]|uniref:Major facilitator superfamily domain-containing protein 12-like n=1 Tax=Trifolium pratense TaxID=57577 RepID=A0A2K3P9H9_TRIPR|nr:major facilitator superfamily domain-containing protein 12-like [Trifolium pratense]